MIEISIWTKENEKDFSYKKPIIQGVENTGAAEKLLPPHIKEMFEIWRKCHIYRNKEEGLLMTLEIYFNEIRYCFQDWYWD